ncbi:MAG TPA: hypothetical protein PKE37_15285 [Thiomonas arsenitoxydans]|jgi:hypothetical protein|uniref:hypothetical protein n=1 Tax=Thiomonas arsenitoxydans (strain DSM 22701 / CIP 110005 / 3As) TaxID=426114 RepID=UPI000BD029F4|nr:hypothetical protein [Thiomonas arsenitoxydans]OZB55561.1 MAG: hypothetical protein B7X43_00675 [Thiomonas sp. 15-63-373]OZB76394.1 MAG: hypothetical protein B7X36_03730 [Thiomonas sp. 14-64-326]HML83120.1 hypothetical protein [Thiomonas arsenitoxydans]
MKRVLLFLLWLVLQIGWGVFMLLRWALLPLMALVGGFVYVICGLGAIISLIGTLIVAVVLHGPDPWAWVGPLLLTCGFLFGIVAYLGVCFVVDPSMSGWLVPRFYADVPFRRHRTDPSEYLQ